MGCLSQSKSQNIDVPSSDNEEILEKRKDFNKIPDDEFICPECDLVPEVLNIHSDNGKIDFLCSKCGEKGISFNDYNSKINTSKYNYFNFVCGKCGETSKNNEIFYYCYDCKKHFCNKCQNEKEHEKHKKIKANEEKNICLNHYQKHFTQFCSDCQENVCPKETKKYHSEHKLQDFKKFQEDFLKYRQIIIEKNRELLIIIKFNKLISNTYEVYPDNYFHLKSIINIGKSIEKENLIKSPEIGFFDKLKKIKIPENNDSKSLFTEISNRDKENKIKDIYTLKGKKFLYLYNNNLNDENFKLISLIKFNQLKELDVSHNNLENIESLNEMVLPFLEILNMSFNKIKNIEPISKMTSTMLKEIYLHNNNINDINSLINSEKEKLEILRIDNNNFVVDENIKTQLKKKYPICEIIINQNVFEDFKNKYNYNEGDKKLEIKDKKEKTEKTEKTQKTEKTEKTQKTEKTEKTDKSNDEIIKDIYINFNDKSEECKIEELNLVNNNISNCSKLGKIEFKNLQQLNLSMNNISNLDFLLEMKLENLTHLLLRENTICNINVLLKIEFKKIELIDLQRNPLDMNDDENKEIIKQLKEKYKEININL